MKQRTDVLHHHVKPTKLFKLTEPANHAMNTLRLSITVSSQMESNYLNVFNVDVILNMEDNTVKKTVNALLAVNSRFHLKMEEDVKLLHAQQ